MSSNVEGADQQSLSGAQNDLLATVRLLSEQIGPREAGSENERLAAAYCLDRLRKAGYEVRLEPFKALKTYSWTYAPLYGLAALGGLLARRSPRLASALGLTALGIFLVENHGFRLFSRLPFLPRGRSQNIVARLKLPDADATPETRIVLTAHLDSARSSLNFHPALVHGFRASFMLSTAAMIMVGLGGLGMALRRRMHTGWPGRVVTIAGAYLLLPLASLLHREIAMPVVAGANDNASGVAVLLAAAERLAHLRGGDKSRLRPSEIIIVLTGGEEAGLEGMQKFLDDYLGELDRENTIFINVDNVGSGDLCLISEEGMLLSRSADADMIDMAMSVALRRGLPIRIRPFHTMLTDAQVPLTRKLRAMSIMTLNEKGLPANWHWSSDVADNVDPNIIGSVLELVVRLVRREVRRKPSAKSESGA